MRFLENINHYLIILFRLNPSGTCLLYTSNAIQWTPGVGEPQGGSPKWYDLYKKILAGGKSIMACWVTLDELKPLLDNIGADGDVYKRQHRPSF